MINFFEHIFLMKDLTYLSTNEFFEKRRIIFILSFSLFETCK